MYNKLKWNTESIIKAYINDSELQLPEQTIFDYVKEDLKNWKVLDIGIGAGRTTLHLAPLTKQYIGIDYSPGMIEACKKKFPELVSKGAIQIGDARFMKNLENAYFDFALFSFNGIDYIQHDDRKLVFEEIFRVVKPGGHFVFSTHNLLYVDNLYRIKLNNNYRHSLYQFYRYGRLIFSNGLPRKYKKKSFAILNDGASHFSLNTYYVQPEHQLEQLKQLGFSNIRLFSHKTGKELSLEKVDELKKESWIYYWCKIP